MEEAPTPPGFDALALDAACRRLGVDLVVLFGSRATGSPPPGEGSDLDVAVSTVASAQAVARWELYEGLLAVFPEDDLDLVRLEDADPLFRWEILRSGVLLRGDPLDFLELRAFAYRDFVDSADLRELEERLFEKKMRYIRRRLDAAS